MRQLKQTIRGILAFKQHALFSLIGLSIGLSSIILIIIWALTHWSFDRFHQEAGQIYFVQYTDTLYNETDFVNPFPLAQELRERIPGMEQTATISFWTDKSKVNAGGNEYYIDITPVEEQLFNILDFDFYGLNDGQVLDVSQIALSQSLAHKIFGTAACVGETMVIQDSILTQVGAVYKDFPENSTFQPEAICHYQLNPAAFIHCSGWKNWCYTTLVKVPEGADVTALGEQITRLLRDERDMEEIFSLYPLLNFHLEPVGEESKVKHLLMVIFSGLLVLIVSCINFVNLQSAIYYKRARQNSIKKMLGVSPRQLISEVIVESAVFVVASLLLTLFVSFTILPDLSEQIGLNITQILSKSELLVIHLLAAGFVFMLIAAYMVAIVLKNARSNDSLIAGVKEKKLHKAGKAFVIAQFALAIFIGISAVTMQQQLAYAIESDKGYDARNLMYVETWDYPFDEHKAAIKEYLSNTHEVEVFSVCERSFNGMGARTTSYTNPEWSDDQNNFYKVLYRCDENLFETTNIQIQNGRAFKPSKFNEENNIIINQTYAKKLGGNVVGKTLKAGKTDCRIIGVCNDFQFENYYKAIEPMVIQYRDEWICNLLIKTSDDSYAEVADGLQQFMSTRANAPFKVSSMEVLLSDLYQEEETQQNLLLLFSALTILISCLGLYGLTTFIIENSTKAIGIRKVNGATITEILWMLNNNFARYVLTAFIVASPLAWYAMSRWLENFAYKTSLSWWIFALAGVLALAIALLTVSWQSWRAARRNPVEALRYE